ncbi:MAG TPA: hypothetical protein VGM91_01635 [Conexibacter sp.]|jgi:hypothetical protein
MSIRYLSNLALGAAGAFLVVATQAFTQNTIQWLAFTVGIIAMLVAAAEIVTVHDRVQRITAAVAAGVGVVLVAMSLIFTITTVTALALALGLALALIALVGLTAHELRAERVVHELSVEGRSTTLDREAAAL